MKSSRRAAIALGAVLALSLGLKVLVSPFGVRGPQPLPRDAELHRFLVAATAAPVQPAAGGWRFQSGGCRLTAFVSGPRGTLDLAATSHRGRRERLAYVYRGRVSGAPPSLALTVDVVGYYLARPFRSLNEPGYVVLLVPEDCPAAPTLPWDRLPVT